MELILHRLNILILIAVAFVVIIVGSLVLAILIMMLHEWIVEQLWIIKAKFIVKKVCKRNGIDYNKYFNKSKEDENSNTNK